MSKDITLTVDYHDRACVIRWHDHSTRKDQVFAEVLTTKKASTASSIAAWRRAPKGRVVWIQESTTGWARVQELLGNASTSAWPMSCRCRSSQGQAAEDRQDRHGTDPA